jgi:hypothetical protein
VSVLKPANVCSGNSKQQRECVAASQCHCIAVRTIQPAVCHPYNHETARSTIQRHSRRDRMHLSNSPLIASLFSALHQTPHTAFSPQTNKSTAVLNGIYIIESEQCCPNGDVNIAVELYTKLIQTSQLLPFCAYFTVSSLISRFHY